MAAAEVLTDVAGRQSLSVEGVAAERVKDVEGGRRMETLGR
jgi:hypothetical protein